MPLKVLRGVEDAPLVNPYSITDMGLVGDGLRKIEAYVEERGRARG